MTSPVRPSPWTALRPLTPARVALGRTGNSLPTAEVLAFGLAHAQARDAVHAALDAPDLAAHIEALGLETLCVTSAAPDRATYLMRPDLGRRLAADDAQRLSAEAAKSSGAGCDLLLVVGDGLSSLAVERHAAPLLEHILAGCPPGWRLGPVVIATQCRVALADEVGERLNARIVAILIGERPGLSSPDSLGIYLTHTPRIGRMDAERNCISNIRPEGLSYANAARRLWWLCDAARRLGHSGVGLKDGSGERGDLLPQQIAESDPNGTTPA
jgi:ethanolamine ammonia-lyase small subunit